MMQLAIWETYKPCNTVQISSPPRLKNKQLFLDMFVVSESKYQMCIMFTYIALISLLQKHKNNRVVVTQTQPQEIIKPNDTSSLY